MKRSLLLAAALSLPATAAAQQGAMQLEQFEPQPSSAGVLSQPTSHVIPGNHLVFELWGHYQRSPLTLYPADGSAPVQALPDRLTGEFLAGYGLLDVADISVAVPWSGAITPSEVAFARRTPDELSTANLGDIRLHIKSDLMNALARGRDRTGGFGVGLGATVWFPTGSVESLTGDRQVRGEARVAADWTAPFGLKVGGNVGFQFQPESHLRADVYTGNRLRWGASLAVPLGPLPMEAIATAYGAVPLRADRVLATNTPAEVLAGVRFRAPFGLHGTIAGGAGLSPAVGVPEGRIIGQLGFDVSLKRPPPKQTGDPDGDGIIDEYDVCPFEAETFNGTRDDDGCPEADFVEAKISTADLGDDVSERTEYRPAAIAALPRLRKTDDPVPNDGDAVSARDDICPNEVEDVDGFEDDDGCADPDNDNDGILDVDDACPLVAETPDGRTDDDGCPDGGVGEAAVDEDGGEDSDGDGVSDARDVCPFEAETVDGIRDHDGCPEAPHSAEVTGFLGTTEAPKALETRLPKNPDSDGDGVVDSADLCPQEREDRDGFQDYDGCPDRDNDGDTIIDRVDRCPLEAENLNGVLDGDGCPDRGPDADKDLVDDEEDRCPEERENRDGVRDHDGCPEGWWAGLPTPVGGTPTDSTRETRPRTPSKNARADVALLPALPRGGDPDGDGLDHFADLCPLVAEDMDGFLDGDGCPEPDNDGDGILDADDQCPAQAESFDGFEDTDGCPDVVPEELAEVAGIVRGIRFRSGSARLLNSSNGTLKAVLAALQADETLSVAISGHTDSQGDRDKNIKLSQDRADAVAEWLRRRGIDTDRMTMAGFGPDQPVDTNDTEEGRAANRRVELSYTNTEAAQ